MSEVIFKEEVYAIIGSAFEVYNELGPGFLEAIYQEAMEIELRERGIPFNSQVKLIVYYKKRPMEKCYVADFVIYDKIVVELKALIQLTTGDDAQLLNELSATQFDLGLLINFGNPKQLEWKRLANTVRKTRRQQKKEESANCR